MTTPDYKILHPDLELSAFVEITKGGGTSKSKQAQRRVIEAAHIKNYVLLTGWDVQSLYEESNLIVRRAILFDFLEWSSVSMKGVLIK